MFTVRVETMPGLKLGSEVWDNVDISKNTGDFIVEAWYERLLYKFHLQQNGSYREEWRCQLPENIKRHCRKFLTDTGNVIMHNEEDSKTFLFDEDMKLIDSWQHQGYLIATLSGERAAYAVGEGEEWHVEIRIQDGDVLQLKPDRNTWESESLSVCDDARTEKLVVMHTQELSCRPILDILYTLGVLDIFSRDGKTMQSLRTGTECQCLCMQLQTPRKLFLDAPLDTHRSIYKTQGKREGVRGRGRIRVFRAGITFSQCRYNRIVPSYNFQTSYNITGWWIIEQTIRKCTRNRSVMVIQIMLQILPRVTHTKINNYSELV